MRGCICTYVCAGYSIVRAIQRNLSITDTLGTEKQFVKQGFPLFVGYFTVYIQLCIYLDHKISFRFSLLEEFFVSSSTVSILTIHICTYTCTLSGAYMFGMRTYIYTYIPLHVE